MSVSPEFQKDTDTMRGIAGLLIMALMVLAIIWAYNKFSGKSIAALGAPTTASA